MCQLNVQMFQKTQKYFCIEQQHISTNQTDNQLSRKEKTREKLIYMNIYTERHLGCLCDFKKSIYKEDGKWIYGQHFGVFQLEKYDALAKI
jgi:hypothetical protein